MAEVPREETTNIDNVIAGSDVSLRTILETAMDGIISIDEQQCVILFNNAAEQIFGWRADQVIGRSIDMLIPDRFRAAHRHSVEQFGRDAIDRRKMGVQRTVWAVKATGEEFPIEASISRTTARNQMIFTVILRDVTEAVRHRQQIEQQSQMLDQVSDAVSLIDPQGLIAYWNQAAVRVFGWTAVEALGKNGRDLLYRGDAETFDQMQRETEVHGFWAGELSKVTRAGVLITVEHRRTVLRGDSGQIKGFLCIDIDVTDRHKRERAARRSQRLESIGTLAGGIAHDLNNVLTPILMGAKLLASGRASNNSKGLLDTMVASAQRGADLIKQLLAFAGGIRGERSTIDIRQSVTETRDLLQHTLPKSIVIETNVASGCPQLMGDPTEVLQILMNLCINSRDAMPDGGTLTIDAKASRIDENAAHLHPDAQAGLYVLVKITDTGCGMSPEILDRIFDPFFTTKEVGKGTGLGLATVQGIVRSYGGFINVYSELGHGTVFSVYLPALADGKQQSNVASPVDNESGNGHLILLVDDETFILQMTGIALESNGYRVLAVRDGQTAISTFLENRDSIAAVVLDMMMPGLDGLQTLEQLRRINPNVIVIACSGLRTAQREAEVLEQGASAFLAKPYSEEQLVQALQRAMNSGQQTR